ncbi:Uncharacterised protein [Mycobacteroides abscessus subsp. abscessus]|nr:Uncharacterised protein [Mycobacteroides abscessus subsp. abscessus]
MLAFECFYSECPNAEVYLEKGIHQIKNPVADRNSCNGSDKRSNN